jgi:hypothetical protein
MNRVRILTEALTMRKAQWFAAAYPLPFVVLATVA